MEDLETFCYNIMDAKSAHLCSEEYKKVNQKKQTKENLARWKKEFKKVWMQQLKKVNLNA